MEEQDSCFLEVIAASHDNAADVAIRHPGCQQSVI